MIQRFRTFTPFALRVGGVVIAPLVLAAAGSIVAVRTAPGGDGFRLALGVLLPVPLWVLATCVAVVDGTSKRFILATALASALAALL